MILTGNYKSFENEHFRTISISMDRGKSAGFIGECYLDLAPKKEFWRTWKDNIGVISEEENTKYYVEHYYDEVLKKLDPEKVYQDLDNKILLCYEDSMEFCHRHLVSAWIELLLGQDVDEATIKNMEIKVVEKPAYIKDMLEECMKKANNMKGFNSLRALYLFEKGNKFDDEVDRLEKENDENFDSYRQRAAFYRCDADIEEEKYIEKIKEKVLVKK